jgi:HTH-type transcriptional regulator/antitoxin HigA
MKHQTTTGRRASKVPAVITHPIRTEAEYDAIVLEMDALFDRSPKPGSPDDERLNLLAMLVEAYDELHYPVPEGTPQDAVLFMLDQQGLTRADLVSVLGSKSRVSEFLNGKRRLSLNQIDALRKMLKIPADVLMEKEPGFTYPAPAVRAAAVRERPPAGPPGELDADLKAFLTQFIRALKQRDERLEKLLNDHVRELRAVVAELRKK